MSREAIDQMWQKAMRQSIEDNEMLTRYHFDALVRADERNASINAVLRVIKELYPALVLAAFSNRDNAWVLNKVKESIEKLKEKN
jgi:hypothetical protein